ncbi:MAG: WbqC family protein [Cyclobacteriaceae bacterium]|nr:WbqC family protein [Cyclobacteriaceae bacterium]
MHKTLVIEPHYLGSLEYFCLLSQFQSVKLEVSDFFIKQTYRNRCYLLNSQGRQLLSVPVWYGQGTTYKDVRIDHSQSWRKDHFRAIGTAYGKAPYFDYFMELFAVLFEKKFEFLLDLNVHSLTICLKILGISLQMTETEAYYPQVEAGETDARNMILPKKEYSFRDIYRPYTYIQNFGKEFEPNLSILDLIMCEGTNAFGVLKQSVK